MLRSSLLHTRVFFYPTSASDDTRALKSVNLVKSSLDPLSSSTPLNVAETLFQPSPRLRLSERPCTRGFCSCGRRRFIGASGLALLPTLPTKVYASDVNSDSQAMLKKVHPPRPGWYEEFYAKMMEKSMKSYEAEISGYKAALFSKVTGKNERVLELGIGTGPNLKYYGSGDAGLHVFGVDPNKCMEKYARAAAIAAGIPLTNFHFMQAVAEALPVSDASMDAVIGTLVLCSVKDIKMTLKDFLLKSEVKRVLKPGGLYIFIEHVGAKDGTVLRFAQNIINPLQQIVSDGCHLTRDTGKYISEAGFSDVEMDMASVSTVSLISPHVLGIARK